MTSLLDKHNAERIGTYAPSSWKDHKCPRDLITGFSGLFPITDHNAACWLCECNMRARYSAYMPYLPGLYAWLDGHDDDDARDLLMEHFFEDMPYGTQKARDGDPDQWLCDNIEQVREFVGDIEALCIEEKAA